jgi:hypothetical protein
MWALDFIRRNWTGHQIFSSQLANHIHRCPQPFDNNVQISRRYQSSRPNYIRLSRAPRLGSIGAHNCCVLRTLTCSLSAVLVEPPVLALWTSDHRGSMNRGKPATTVCRPYKNKNIRCSELPGVISRFLIEQKLCFSVFLITLITFDHF